MPTFAYRAVDEAGRRTRGTLTAASETAAARDLEIQGLLAVDLREDGTTPAKGFRFGRRRGVLEFTRGMAALLPAGMPLARALEVSTSTSPVVVQPALVEVRERIQRGDELAAALKAHPDLFSSLYVGIVRAGEKTGALDAAFGRLAEHLEREDELRSKLVSMSIYPAVLTVVGIASVLILLLFVLPRFAELLEGSGAPLPRSTALILSLSTAAREAWMVVALVPIGLVVVLAWMRGTGIGRRTASRILVSLPVVGTWRRQALAVRFSRMAGELIAGGSPLLPALRDTADCMADPIAHESIDWVWNRVREGWSLNRALRETRLFPPALPQLVALGEESGRLPGFLLKSADLLERRTERALERMVALAEPAMIVLFGAIVAVVALSLLQAIYGMNPGTLR